MKTILIIDDEYDIISSLEMILSFEGYAVLTAFHGADAMAILKSSPVPDLIISDMTMPVLDGYGLLNAVKSHDKLKNIPIILMSAAQLDHKKLDKLHFELFMRKPLDIDRFLSDVKKVLAHKVGKV
jgi:CheY-like chemotaxis protein